MNRYNEYGVNINNVPMFISKLGNNKCDIKMKGIYVFTSNNYLIQFLFKMKGFKLRKLDNKKMVLQYKKEMVEFNKISDFLVEDREQEKQFLLNFRNRLGRCHIGSLAIIGSGDKLVTGYIDCFSGNRIIHSWIENDDKVIDYVFNAIIDKDVYYKLVNAQPLNFISKEIIAEDSSSEFINAFLSCKFYLLFRDEINRSGLIDFGDNVLIKK